MAQVAPAPSPESKVLLQQHLEKIVAKLEETRLVEACIYCYRLVQEEAERQKKRGKKSVEPYRRVFIPFEKIARACESEPPRLPIVLPIAEATGWLNQLITAIWEFVAAIQALLGDDRLPPTIGKQLLEFTASPFRRLQHKGSTTLPDGKDTQSRTFPRRRDDIKIRDALWRVWAGLSKVSALQSGFNSALWQHEEERLPIPFLKRVGSSGLEKQFPVMTFSIEGQQYRGVSPRVKSKSPARGSLDLRMEFRKGVSRQSQRLDAEQSSSVSPIFESKSLARSSLDPRMEPWKSISRYSERHRKYSTQRLNGTCQWIFSNEKYCEWRQAEGASTLWCVGAPGVGKTVLSSMVIDELIKTDYKNVAYFYMADGKTQSASEVMASIVFQLSASNGIVPAPLDLDQTRPATGSSKLPTIKSLVTALQDLGKALPQISVVIDDFDEHNLTLTGEYDILLESFSALPWKLFLTRRDRTGWSPPRPEPGLEPICITVDKEMISADIRAVVEAALDDFLRTHTESSVFKGLRDEIVTSVVDASEARFVIAAVRLDNILQQPSISSMRQALNSQDPVFLRALQIIDQQPEAQQRLSRKAIVWVTALDWSLKMAGLCEALAVEDMDPQIPFDHLQNRELVPIQDRLLEWCNGLITRDPSSLTVSLAHHETQAYISKGWHSPGNQTIMPLSWVSLQYLSMDCFRQGLCETETDLQECMAKYQFLEYAAHSWFNACNSRISSGENLDQPCMNNPETSSTRPKDKDGAVAMTVKLLQQKANLSLALQVYFWSKSPPGLDNSGWRMLRDRAATWSCLHVAAHFGLSEAITQLLNTGLYDTSMQDSRGRTPLHEATRKGHTSIAELLASKMTTTAIQDHSGKYPVNHAYDKIQAYLEKDQQEMRQQYTGLLVSLMKHCALELVPSRTSSQRPTEVSMRKSKHGKKMAAEQHAAPPVFLEGVPERKEILDYLVNSNPFYSASGGSVAAPKELYIRAATQGDVAMIFALLEKGMKYNVSPDARDEKMIPALHLAMGKEVRHEQAVQAILMKEADPSIYNENLPNESALQRAIRVASLETVHTLITWDANIDYHDKNGTTALSQAVRSGSLDKVRLLLKSGASLHTSKSGPFLHTSKSGASLHTSKSGASLHTSNTTNPTVLFDAIDQDLDMMKLLLSKHVDLEEKNSAGNSVLFESVYRSKKAMVMLLLHNGADILTRNLADEGLLHAAVQGGDLDIIKEIVARFMKFDMVKGELERRSGKKQTPIELSATSARGEEFKHQTRMLWDSFAR